LKISAQLFRFGEGSIDEKETICPPNEAKKTIQEWINWFREQLTEAMKQGEDVEILLGRKPNNGNNFTV